MNGAAARTAGAGLPGRLPGGGPGDEELLDLVLGGDEAAFRELVDRHGPMVLGACRQVLGRHHDAEDAFQATFLTLARRAGSIRNKMAVGAWLREVAYHTAARARTRAARRRTREAEAGATSTGVGRPAEVWSDLGQVLHQEVRRLPETYRRAVVLCYLEERTNEEAAAILRWPVGTVKGRLSRARVLLRARLTRRGLAPPVVFG